MIGRIYKITCSLDEDVLYVGSTTRNLNDRWWEHISNYKSGNRSKLGYYPYVDIYGIDKFRIELIKEYEIIDTKHLHSKEQLWINKLNCCNKVNAITIGAKHYHKNYYQENKEYLKSKAKKYFNDNREIVLKKQREYTEKNKEKKVESDKKYRLKNRDKIRECHRNYYQEHKEERQEYSKKYYQEKGEKICEYQCEKITCECGTIISRGHLTRHKKTKKHQQLINNI